ncbi:MAG: divalent-cation tolerance protein CutA [Candidatus Diapherotrites archaeon]|nr:divalent-cation tolerance protein CutA [Candidatus Diapherotrites archaeon]
MARLSFFYVTFGSRKEARRVVEVLLAEKLVFCVNILGSSESHYFWKGKKESARETVALLKTFSSKRKKLLSRVRELHSFKVPAVAEIPIKYVNPEYERWAEGVLKQ